MSRLYILLIGSFFIIACGRSKKEILINIDGRVYCLDCYYASAERLPYDWSMIESETYKPNGIFILADDNIEERKCDSLSRKFSVRLRVEDGFLREITLFKKKNTTHLHYEIIGHEDSVDVRSHFHEIIFDSKDSGRVIFTSKSESGLVIYQEE